MSMYEHKKPKYIPSGQHVDKRYFLMNKKFPTKLRNEKKREELVIEYRKKALCWCFGCNVNDENKSKEMS